MALNVELLKKSYRSPSGEVVRVLDVPAFSMESGEQLAMIGSSGSGKTTLLHTIAGIVRPDSGAVFITVFDPQTRTPQRVNVTTLSESARDHFRGRHIGYVFQTHHLLPGFSALENVLLGMSFTGRPPDRAWAEHLLEAVGLADRLHYRPAKLSVGQQQRVAVARALANRPALVLADEPTGALDAVNAAAVLELIRSLCGEVRASLLMVTHDRQIASTFERVVDLASINLASKAVCAEAAR